MKTKNFTQVEKELLKNSLSTSKLATTYAMELSNMFYKSGAGIPGVVDNLIKAGTLNTSVVDSLIKQSNALNTYNFGIEIPGIVNTIAKVGSLNASVVDSLIKQSNALNTYNFGIEIPGIVDTIAKARSLNASVVDSLIKQSNILNFYKLGSGISSVIDTVVEYNRTLNALKSSAGISSTLTNTLSEYNKTLSAYKLGIGIINESIFNDTLISVSNILKTTSPKRQLKIYQNPIFTQIWKNTSSNISEEDIYNLNENLDEFQEKLENDSNININIEIVLNNVKQQSELKDVEEENIKKSLVFLLLSIFSSDKDIAERAKAIFKFLIAFRKNEAIDTIVWYFMLFIALSTFIKS